MAGVVGVDVRQLSTVAKTQTEVHMADGGKLVIDDRERSHSLDVRLSAVGWVSR